MISNARLPALASFVAAGVWPWFVSSLSRALMSPIDRALSDAWCGVPLHASGELLGHCAACWAGSALLAGLGAFLLIARDDETTEHTSRHHATLARWPR